MDLHLSDYMTWKEHQAQGAGKGFSQLLRVPLGLKPQGPLLPGED